MPALTEMPADFERIAGHHELAPVGIHHVAVGHRIFRVWSAGVHQHERRAGQTLGNDVSTH